MNRLQELRPRNRQDRLGEPGDDHERHSVAGSCRWGGICHQRFPWQQSQGHPSRRRERGSHRFEGHRLVARSRHAVCAVTSHYATGILYLLKVQSPGILSAFDAKSGKPHYQLQRLDGIPQRSASPVGANGRVYLTGRDGTTLVIRHGPAFEVLSQNRLTMIRHASPALVEQRDLHARLPIRLSRSQVSRMSARQSSAQPQPSASSSPPQLLYSGEKFTSLRWQSSVSFRQLRCYCCVNKWSIPDSETEGLAD